LADSTRDDRIIDKKNAIQNRYAPWQGAATSDDTRKRQP
jgi:hypothetical protein